MFGVLTRVTAAAIGRGVDALRPHPASPLLAVVDCCWCCGSIVQVRVFMQFSEFFVPLPVESLRSVYRGATASALFACLPSSGTLHLVVRVVIPKYTSPLLTLRLAPLPSDPEFVAPSFTLRGESPELPSPMAACCFVFWLDKF